jgi:uncharacterized protein YndB with AHSA1/START domain
MADDSHDQNALAVRREVILPVARDVAWRALADADGLSGWLADEVELEIREGANGTMSWRGGEQRRVSVEEVTDQRRLALHWCEPGGEPSLVELTLEDAEAGTRLTVIEVPLVTLRAVTAAVSEYEAPAAGPQMRALAIAA